MSAPDGHLWQQATDVHVPGGRFVALLPGGSENLSARIASPHGDMVLRTYRHADHLRFTGELQTLRRLAGAGAPAPRPKRWGVACPVFGTPFLTYPWLPGETLTAAATSLSMAQVAQAVTQVMGIAINDVSALPAQSFGYLHVRDTPPTGTATSHHALDAYAQLIATHHLIDTTLLDHAVRVVQTHAATVSICSPRLVHPDLKPDNLLISGAGVTILDWELPVGGHPMLNYGGLLADGIPHPAVRTGLRQHLHSLDRYTRTAAVTAGLLRCLETLHYLPDYPAVYEGRKRRPDAGDLSLSVQTLLDWMPR